MPPVVDWETGPSSMERGEAIFMEKKIRIGSGIAPWQIRQVRHQEAQSPLIQERSVLMANFVSCCCCMSEDYQGPTSSGFFKWVPDENGQMRPVTRMKEKVLDKPGMWNKVNSENDE